MHWGTLKLFLGEFRFLTAALHLIKGNFKCIYLSVTATPNARLLEKIFPVEIITVTSPSDAAAEYDKYGIVPTVMYSDLRTGCSEKHVRNDMQTQLKVWQMLNPALASLKFRLEYTNGGDDTIVDYPDGMIYLLPYTGPTSTESQLIVQKDASMKKYSSIIYEEQMFYHNTVARNSRYDVIGELSLHEDGLCNCYDCSAFISIIREYLYTIKNVDASANVVKKIADMFSKSIAPGKDMITQTTAGINRNWAFMFFRSYKLCDERTCKYCVLGKSMALSNDYHE